MILLSLNSLEGPHRMSRCMGHQRARLSTQSLPLQLSPKRRPPPRPSQRHKPRPRAMTMVPVPLVKAQGRMVCTLRLQLPPPRTRSLPKPKSRLKQGLPTTRPPTPLRNLLLRVGRQVPHQLMLVALAVLPAQAKPLSRRRQQLLELVVQVQVQARQTLQSLPHQCLPVASLVLEQASMTRFVPPTRSATR